MRTIQTFADYPVPWTVRVLRKGMQYGKDFKLTYNKDEPAVEFYDARRDIQTPLGQFVARYYLKTLKGHERGYNLALDGGVPEWTVSEDVLNEILEWVNSELGNTH